MPKPPKACWDCNNRRTKCEPWDRNAAMPLAVVPTNDNQLPTTKASEVRRVADVEIPAKRKMNKGKGKAQARGQDESEYESEGEESDGGPAKKKQSRSKAARDEPPNVARPATVVMTGKPRSTTRPPPSKTTRPGGSPKKSIDKAPKRSSLKGGRAAARGTPVPPISAEERKRLADIEKASTGRGTPLSRFTPDPELDEFNTMAARCDFISKQADTLEAHNASLRGTHRNLREFCDEMNARIQNLSSVLEAQDTNLEHSSREIGQLRVEIRGLRLSSTTIHSAVTGSTARDPLDRGTGYGGNAFASGSRDRSISTVRS